MFLRNFRSATLTSKGPARDQGGKCNNVNPSMEAMSPNRQKSSEKVKIKKPATNPHKRVQNCTSTHPMHLIHSVASVLLTFDFIGWCEELFATEEHGRNTEKRPNHPFRTTDSLFLCMARKNLEEKNPGKYVARLASTFFRVFSVFRGSDSSPDWVAGMPAPGPLWQQSSPFFVLFCPSRIANPGSLRSVKRKPHAGSHFRDGQDWTSLNAAC
jgi:hypothetical protein